MKKMVVMLVGVLLMSILSADISVPSYTVNPEAIRPGGSGSISIVIANQGTNPVEDISVYVSSYPHLRITPSVYVGDLQIGGQTMINIPVRVAEDTPPGVYTVRLNIRGMEKDSSQSTDERQITRGLDIPIYVVNPPLFTVFYSPITVTKSSDYNLTLTVTNNGGDARDVSIVPVCPGFSFYSSSPVYLGDMSKNESENTTLRFRVDESVIPGEQNCILSIMASDDLGNLYNQTIPISVTVKDSVPMFIITSQTDHVSPGENTVIKLSIDNSGDKSVYNVRLKLGQNEVFVPKTAEVYVAEGLRPKETVEVDAHVGVLEVAPGYYSIPATVVYEDELGRVHEEAESFILQVSTAGLLKIFVESDAVPLYEGSNYHLSVKVSNTGISQVKSVIVELEDSSGLQILNPQIQQYIGTLDADDFSSVMYNVHIPKGVVNGEESILTLEFKVDYLDSFNRPHQEIIDVPITVYSSKVKQQLEGKDSQEWVLPTVIVLIVLGTAFYFIKRRRRRTDNQ